MQAMSENTIVKGDVGDVWGMAAEDRRLSLYMAVSMACVISSLVCGEMLCNVTRTDLEESLSSSCLFLFDMVNPWSALPRVSEQKSRRIEKKNHVAGTGKLKLLANANLNTRTSTQHLRETKPLSAHKYFTVLTKTRKEMIWLREANLNHKKKEGDRR
jgi:hypothetical protein